MIAKHNESQALKVHAMAFDLLVAGFRQSL